MTARLVTMIPPGARFRDERGNVYTMVRNHGPYSKMPGHVGIEVRKPNGAHAMSAVEDTTRFEVIDDA